MQYKKNLLFVQKRSSKMFLIAFLVSLTVWLLINLSKVYERTVTVKISYENLDKSTFVRHNDSVLMVKIKGTGFSLITGKLKSLNYTIDTKAENKQWSWHTKDYEFNRLFPKNIEVLNVTPRNIAFSVQKLSKKSVPISSQLIVRPKKGYGIKNYRLDKDFIMIYGDKQRIDAISEIKTESLIFKDVTKSLKGKARLLFLDKNLEIETKEIGYSYNIERFTQGNFNVDIQLKNIPKDRKVTIFPKQVAVQFQSPLSLFSDYRADGFGVYVDFNEINDSNILPIHIEFTPKGTENVKVLKKSVTYLLIEK